MHHTLVPAHRIFPLYFLGFFSICCLISYDFHAPLSGAHRGSTRKKRTSNGKWNRKHPKKVAIEKLATKLADLRAELEAARREVRATRATADGLSD